MAVGDQIKELRKMLHLTQQAFADRIGSVQNTITGYETGRRIPSNQVISLICLEFGVSEEWLRTGEGKPFPTEPSNVVQFAAAHPKMSDVDMAIMEAYFSLSEEQKEVFLQYCLKVAAAWQAKNGEKNTAAARSGDRMDVTQVSPDEEEAALPPDYTGDI